MSVPDPSLDTLADRFAALGVAAIWLFGSRARGTARPDSDADIALLLHRGADTPGLMEQSLLADSLREPLSSPEVDVVVLDGAPLTLCGRVLVEGTLLWCGDDVRRVRYTVDTLSRYFDALPSIREQDRAYLAAVAERGL